MAELARLGIPAFKTEMFVGGGSYGFRRDLMGWMDVLAVTEGRHELIGIQACSMSTRSEHLRKMIVPQVWANIRRWVGGLDRKAEIWAWRKLKVKRGGKAMRWKHEVTDLGMLDSPMHDERIEIQIDKRLTAIQVADAVDSLTVMPGGVTVMIQVIFPTHASMIQARRGMANVEKVAVEGIRMSAIADKVEVSTVLTTLGTGKAKVVLWISRLDGPNWGV
jgi:hypothetical protein